MSANATTRPSKRARSSPEQENAHPHASTFAVSLSDLERHPEFWFDDGNIVLVAQHTGFRIFRGLLATQSTIFADMFASSSSSADETLDGCPVVQLTDSVLDLTYFFRILLPTSPICYPTAQHDVGRSFDEISAVARLAHKYHIQSVQDQALRALQEFPFTNNLSIHARPPKRRVAIHGAQYIGAVNLARLTDTPLILPLAFLQCCYLGGRLIDGWTRQDGTTEHLCTADIKRCIDARVVLIEEHFLLLCRIFGVIPRVKCTAGGLCSAEVSSILRNNVSIEELVKKPVFMDWAPFIQTTGVCEGCKQVLLERNQAERQRTWDSLPRVFGITVEGWAKTDGAGAASTA